MTPAGMAVLLAVEPVDMRRSFDGLALWVKTSLGREAGPGTLYVFVNRRRDMAKVLWRDGTGWCLLAKRLDERTVAFPANIVRRRSETAKSIARAARAAVENARTASSASQI
jgi:transposase